jgi:phosphatidylinositol alpha-1,6-mannosyltransferase
MTAAAPLRIVMVTQNFTPDPGGIETTMGGLAHELAAAGHALTVFADRIRSGRAEDTPPAIPIHRFGGPRPLRRLRKRLALWRALRQAPPDAIIADSWKSVEALPATPARLLVLAHGMEFPPAPSAGKAARIRAALGRAAAIAANSRYTAGLVAPYRGAGQVVAVVQPVIRPQPAPPPADRQAVAALIGDGGPVLLSLARLEPRKGFDMVIRALPALAAEFPGILHLVAGSGPDAGRLRALAEQLGVARHLRLLGRVEEGMKAALFSRADVFAMPARREGASVEGFGLVYLEAGWHGAPSLAGRDGGAADAVADGETGLVCDGADAAAVQAALLALLRDPGRRAAMGAAAAARVRRDFLWPAVVPRYVALLRGDS